MKKWKEKQCQKLLNLKTEVFWGNKAGLNKEWHLVFKIQKNTEVGLLQTKLNILALNSTTNRLTKIWISMPNFMKKRMKNVQVKGPSLPKEPFLGAFQKSEEMKLNKILESLE